MKKALILSGLSIASYCVVTIVLIGTFWICCMLYFGKFMYLGQAFIETGFPLTGMILLTYFFLSIISVFLPWIFSRDIFEFIVEDNDDL